MSEPIVTRISMPAETPAEPAAPKVETTETPTGVTVRPAAGTEETPPAETRPDFIPEKFWKGNLEESAKAMAASYGELERKQSQPAKEEPKPETPPAKTETPPAKSEPSAEAKAFAQVLGAAFAQSAGSETEVKATLDWARANATAEDKAMFDASLDSGNPALAQMAFQTLRSKYTEAVGTQGTRVEGETSPTTSGAKPYASRDELLAVVASKGYKSGDPAVHALHLQRLAVTTWF